MSTIIRDCGEIWSRLFDHRPFLGGEILYFHEEFEVKRSDREITRLLNVLEHVTELRDAQLPNLNASCENNLPTFQRKLDAALSDCSNILDKEDKFNIDASLEVKREVRKSEWKRFQSEMETKYSAIDKSFNDKEKELFEFYTDLEKKLYKSE